MDTITTQELLPTGFDARLLQILEANPQGLSEFALIKELALAFPDSLFAMPGALREPLLLFQLHFLLFHVLYRLSDNLAASRRELVINVLHIAIVQRAHNAPGLRETDPLRNYYLDWNQWLETRADDVERLLDQFWKSRPSHVAEAEVHWARQLLGLTATDNAEAIKLRYRRLMMQHHPDRGGDAQRGSEINSAYLILNRYYKVRQRHENL